LPLVGGGFSASERRKAPSFSREMGGTLFKAELAEPLVEAGYKFPNDRAKLRFAPSYAFSGAESTSRMHARASEPVSSFL